MKRIVCNFCDLPLRVQESVLYKIVKDHKLHHEGEADYIAFDKLDALDFLKEKYMDELLFEYSYHEEDGYQWRYLDFEHHEYEVVPHVSLV